MYVDHSTLVFRGLSNQEASDLRKIADLIVFEGKLPPDLWENSITKLWLVAGNFDERQALLVISTVFPCRAYYSLLCHAEMLESSKSVDLE